VTSVRDRVMLVLIALLCGVIAGLVAGYLMIPHGAQIAIFAGFIALVGATGFVLTIEKALGLLS
jgi:hypothetical protein